VEISRKKLKILLTSLYRTTCESGKAEKKINFARNPQEKKKAATRTN
jgi:hypothetical protein